MEKIKYPKIEVWLSKEDVDEINTLLDRDKAVDGIPDKVGGYDCNRCPKCKTVLSADEKFCSKCGQRVNYIKSDVIPFDSEEVDA